MKLQNRVTGLFGIEIPIIQAGMVWASGWRLASAVSNAGGLGILGAGSMHPHILEEHVQKLRQVCDKPFAVNLPLLYPAIEDHIKTILQYKVPVVFTSAGNPNIHTQRLKDAGIRVVHVVSSSKFALKAQEAGCDAVVAEGFEAGGHNGREETTTIVLVPQVVKVVDIPVIAAGGIGFGRQMAAALCLGAEGVQVGSRFVATPEASSHMHFKELILKAAEGDTKLAMKSLTPVRLLKNAFYDAVADAEAGGATKEELLALLGKGRAKRGMFEGDLREGELEIGQVSGLIDELKPAAEVVREIWEECKNTLHSVSRQFEKGVERVVNKCESHGHDDRHVQETEKMVYKSQEEKISIPITGGFEFIPVKAILHIESSGNYSNLHLVNDKKILVTRLIGDFEALLAPYNFFRVHNSHLVNVEHIKKYIRGEGGHIVMNNDEEIDISRRKKDELLQLIGGLTME